MRITREADYAVRIVHALMTKKQIISARELSEITNVTFRFTLKILHKLTSGGIVYSLKGAKGGYKLAIDPSLLSLGEIIECIDGPLMLSHCQEEDISCNTHPDKNDCPFHAVFETITGKLKKELYDIKMSQLLKE